MCDDHVDHWTHSEHNARTWKKCSECDGLIAPNDRYVRIAIINDGSAETFNMHIACDQLSAEVATDGSCRMLMPNSVIDWLAYGDCDDEIGARRLLRWMRVNSRFRFAKLLGQSWEAAHANV